MFAMSVDTDSMVGIFQIFGVILRTEEVGDSAMGTPLYGELFLRRRREARSTAQDSRRLGLTVYVRQQRIKSSKQSPIWFQCVPGDAHS